MTCDVCHKKKATVHLTEIVDGQMPELHICEECAREKSIQMEQQFGLADLLAGLTDLGKQPKTAERFIFVCTNPRNRRLTRSSVIFQNIRGL